MTRKAFILSALLLMASSAHAASLKDTTVTGDLTVTGTITGNGSGLTNLTGSGWTKATGKVYTTTSTDNVGIATTAPIANLQVGAGTNSVSGAPTLGSKDALITGNLVVDGKLYGDGSALTGLGSGSGTVNSGTAGYFAYYPSSTAAVSSQTVLYTDATNVGIGTSAPAGLFDVNRKLTVLSTGSVGVGTTAPVSPLTVYSGTSPELTVYGNGNGAFLATSRSSNGAGGSGVMFQTNGSTKGMLTLPNSDDSLLELMTGGGSVIATFQLSGSLYVGIGTTAPLANLQVGAGTNSVSGAPTLGAKDALITGNLVVDGKLYGDGSVLTGLSSSQWTTGASSAIYYNSGNVGIGAAAPIRQFTMTGQAIIGSSSTPNSAATLQVIGDGGGYSEILMDSSKTYGLTYQYTAPGGVPTFSVFGDYYSGSTTPSLVFGTYTHKTDQLVLTSTGNVGIGTTLPIAQLQVGVGTNSVSGSPTLGSKDALIAGNLVVDGKLYGDGSLLSGIAASQWTTSSPNIYYSTGNVGIGTTAPVQKLEVSGTVKASGFSGPVIRRIGAITSSSTPTPDADSQDMYTVTALAADATFGVPTGTPVNGQSLLIRILDNGTARALSWNAIYRAVGITLPTTTVISKTLYLGMIYNSPAGKWDVLAVGQE